MHSQVDEEKLLEFADGTRVPSATIKSVSLSFAGVSHPVRTLFVWMAAYEIIEAPPNPQGEMIANKGDETV
jgi:hypothetical protein